MYVIYDKVSFLIIVREEAVHWNLQVYDFATLVSLMVLIGLVWSLFYLMDETSSCIFLMKFITRWKYLILVWKVNIFYNNN